MGSNGLGVSVSHRPMHRSVVHRTSQQQVHGQGHGLVLARAGAAAGGPSPLDARDEESRTKQQGRQAGKAKAVQLEDELQFASSASTSPLSTSQPLDMQKNVLGVILGGGAGTRLYPLTKKRAKPAVPLGANYRLIDIPVSNCINSGINKMYCLTQFNSASLNRHMSQAWLHCGRWACRSRLFCGGSPRSSPPP